MDNNLNYSPEELQAMLEKAQRELQAKLDSMTPEERKEATARAKAAIEADKAESQKLIDDAAKLAAGVLPTGKATPKFCQNCGAPVSGGNFCPNCGSRL